MDFAKYLNALVGLGLSGAAASLSSTLLKAELIPEQIEWLGAAGTVVAVCFIAVAFSFRQHLAHRAKPLSVILVVLLALLIFLRIRIVVTVDFAERTSDYLIGFGSAERVKPKLGECAKHPSFREQIQCAGAIQIPELYGWTYDLAYACYVLIYLGLLAIFVLLINSLQLAELTEATKT